MIKPSQSRGAQRGGHRSKRRKCLIARKEAAHVRQRQHFLIYSNLAGFEQTFALKSPTSTSSNSTLFKPFEAEKKKIPVKKRAEVYRMYSRSFLFVEIQSILSLVCNLIPQTSTANIMKVLDISHFFKAKYLLFRLIV
jgi:hypothetical protein